MRHGALLALVSAALFGLSTPLSKPLLDGLGPVLLAALLYLGAALVLSPGVLRRFVREGTTLPPDRPNRLRLGGAVLFGGVLGPVLLLSGLSLAKAASVAMWLNLETVATAVLGVTLFREQLGWLAWVGNGVVFVAGLLLAWEGGPAGWTAAALVAGAAVCWGLDNNLTAVIDGLRPEESTFWKGLVAGSTNLTLAAVLGQLVAPDITWVHALVLGAFAYGLSITLYITSAQGIGAVRSQMLFATAPVFGIVGAALWLGEGMAPLQVLAAGLLVVANALWLFDDHGHSHHHEATRHEHWHRHDDGHHRHDHPGLEVAGWHCHDHDHDAVEHEHPHVPDLHHRHPHEPGGST